MADPLRLPVPGKHTFRTECNDTSNPALHGVTGEIEVRPYTGDNPLLRHGPIRVAEDRRHFAHADGTPFFWLGDTWWMGFASRLRWPGDFQELAADRREKGFTVIQIVAGLYPDMPAFIDIGQRFDVGEGEELKAFHTAGFLGSEFGPFFVPDPTVAQQSVQPPVGMSPSRFENRYAFYKKMLDASPVRARRSRAMYASWTRSSAAPRSAPHSVPAYAYTSANEAR